MENQATQYSYIDTSATQKIFKLRKRIRAVAGGTSASKTISILIWLIDYSQTLQGKEKLVTVTSESYPHLEKGAMLDFENIMKDRGYWRDDRWNKTKHIYTFETGNKMEFSTFDTYNKAHGPRRDILYVNEGNNMPYNIIDQLITRTREIVWMDWNPSNEFWFYTEMLPFRPDDIDFITLTYKDNEALDKVTVQEIESHMHNKAWWTVYGLGQLGSLESQIYKNWTEIDEIPPEAVLSKRGLDFGYSVDPTVLEDLYKWNDSWIFDERLYMKGLSNKAIADFILNEPEKVMTIADSSEPKSIDEIASYGVLIVGAQKGPGSVMQGIQYLQGQKIFVTKRSVKTIKARRNYVFVTDKDGKIINEPDDTIHEWSNPMDSCRYALDSFRVRKKYVQNNNVGGVKPYIEGTII